jgi:GC-rich sequence DNA-binding factor
MLLKSVITTFRTSVDSLLSTTSSFLTPTSSYGHAPFTPDAVPARRRFLVRRLKLVRNLLRWRRYTGELFGVGELVMRVVQECARPVAEAGGGWEVGGGEVFGMVSIFEL